MWTSTSRTSRAIKTCRATSCSPADAADVILHRVWCQPVPIADAEGIAHSVVDNRRVGNQLFTCTNLASLSTFRIQTRGRLPMGCARIAPISRCNRGNGKRWEIHDGRTFPAKCKQSVVDEMERG